MLRKIGAADMSDTAVEIAKADFPLPFKSGLEYNAPARGVWNIVHTGMLLPESHQIFACAQGCLRGVILTAAEMNAMDRMSYITTTENNMFDGTMEQSIIDGTEEILEKLDKKPKAVLLFLSCIHMFAGCDFEMIIKSLRERFPDIDFADCYMTPTMRKSISPDAKMRMQLYSLLKPAEKNPLAVNIIGNDRPTDEESELVKIIRNAGLTLRDITLCKSYDEYMEMSEGAVNIAYLPSAVPAGERLESRLGQEFLYLPLSYSYEEISENYERLCRTLDIETPDFSEEIEQAEQELSRTLKKIGETAVAVDYTATPRPLGLARLLLTHGFNVKYVFADVFSEEERAARDFLAENFPQLMIRPTLNVKMRFEGNSEHKEKVLAVGQKAAYFCGTDNFVNIVSGGGFYGFKGISRLCGMIRRAFEEPADRRKVIQLKGLGCESCL